MAKATVSVAQIVSPVPSQYKNQLKAILDSVDGNNWRRPESGSGTTFPKNGQGVYIIYLDDSMMASLRQKHPGGQNAIVSGKEAYLLPIGSPARKISFRITGKKGGGAADAKTTAAQERGSIYIFRRVLANNKRYRSAADIRNDTQAYRALERIWKLSGLEFDDDWLEDYYKQSATMLQKYADASFTEFIRDGGFMKWVTDLVREKYQISQKDNWNPADVWLVKNQRKVIKDIEELVDGGRSQTLEELNAILRTLFKEKIVVGVSLKKVSGSVARWEEVNVDEDQFKEYDKMYYEVSEIQCNLKLKTEKGKLTFGSQDSRVFVSTNVDTLNFQIKANDSAAVSGSNLKFEPTASGATAARLGKSPVDMVRKLMIDYGITYESNHQRYPNDVASFLDVEDDYKKMLAKLMSARGAFKPDFGIDDVDTAINNITMVFGTNPHVAKSKLMQIQFLHMLVSLTPVKKRNMFMTDMGFLAQKKGRRFGPFGKLY
jgi:hypothetical protein